MSEMNAGWKLGYLWWLLRMDALWDEPRNPYPSPAKPEFWLAEDSKETAYVFVVLCYLLNKAETRKDNYPTAENYLAVSFTDTVDQIWDWISKQPELSELCEEIVFKASFSDLMEKISRSSLSDETYMDDSYKFVPFRLNPTIFGTVEWKYLTNISVLTEYDKDSIWTKVVFVSNKDEKETKEEYTFDV